MNNNQFIYFAVVIVEILFFYNAKQFFPNEMQTPQKAETFIACPWFLEE